MLVAFAGAGIYVVSFVACLKSFWIFPFAAAGYLVQLLWMVRAMSEEDEEPWLLAAVVPVVAWQVLGCAETCAADDLLLPIAFLGAFTLCWVAACVVRGWMRRRDMSLWDLIDTTRQRFGPSFCRWRPPEVKGKSESWPRPFTMAKNRQEIEGPGQEPVPPSTATARHSFRG